MMSPPVSNVPPKIKFGLLLLVMLPCLPGMIFLLVGFMTDPHLHPRDLSSAGQTEYARTWARTRGLYLAGAVVLMAGTLGMAAVVWKIARPGSWQEEGARSEIVNE